MRRWTCLIASVVMLVASCSSEQAAGSRSTPVGTVASPAPPATQRPTDDTSTQATDEAGFGRATSSPASVAAGDSVLITPAEPTSPACGIVGVLRSATDHSLLGQVTRDGGFIEGPNVTWLACLEPTSGDSEYYSLPGTVPTGSYVLCMTEQLDAASCATITVTPPAGPASNTESNLTRIDVAAGCPPRVDDHQRVDHRAIGISNPDPSGLTDALVPGRPTGALICRYTALRPISQGDNYGPLTGGDLASATALEATAATEFADALNAIDYWSFTPTCEAGEFAPTYTAIVFTIPDRADVDVWLDWVAPGCSELTNGLRTSGLLVNGHGQEFLRLLDDTAPPA